MKKHLSGVSYLTNGGFLEPEFMSKRLAKEAGVQPNPIKAILQFNEQLKARDIKLIIMPMPIKPMLYPEMLTGKSYELPLQNSSFEAFSEAMKTAGVIVFDPAQMLVKAKQSGMNVFLKTDTHWTPQAMQLVSQQLSRFISQQLKLSSINNYNATVSAKQINAQGDIAEMLKIEDVDLQFPRQSVTINEVIVNKSYWRIDKNAEILLLGDSFLNIYSLSAMGWGGHAGFAEQLAFYLQRPIDAICRNDAGAYATRQQLDQELKRGNDRLTGKKIVIWEFARREFADGNWKLFDMHLGKPAASKFEIPEQGKAIEVEAVIVEVSAVPRPGSVPYKDHVMSLHLATTDYSKHYFVYAMSMKDNTLQAVADLRIGETVKMKLCNWQDVENKYGGLNRSDLDDEDIALEDPCWGEIK
jgi:alginate O-acetyltransferase complex protein AlgJ